MFKKIRVLVARAKAAVLGFNAKRIITVAVPVLLVAVLGETSGVDVTSITELMNSLLPLIIMMISIAIPIMFFKYLMKFLKEMLSGFG